ncbi:MAG: hypothetical protein AB7N71_00410 [Phycisphaerae bacterium]
MMTFLLLGLFIVFLYSSRRAITWDSLQFRYQAILMLGTVSFAWRPDGFDFSSIPPSMKSGFQTAKIFGGTWLWWFADGENFEWKFITVPLWMIGLPLLLLTGFFWWKDRRRVRQAASYFWMRFRPVQRQRLTFLLYFLFVVVHVFVVFFGVEYSVKLFHFFVSLPVALRLEKYRELVFLRTLPIIFLGAPVWGLLWAWLFVRIRNRFPRPANCCFECGYDLTGNETGYCPECRATVIEKNGIKTARAR